MYLQCDYEHSNYIYDKNVFSLRWIEQKDADLNIFTVQHNFFSLIFKQRIVVTENILTSRMFVLNRFDVTRCYWGKNVIQIKFLLV